MANAWTWCLLLAIGLPLATADTEVSDNKDDLTYVMAFPVEDKLIAEESETVSKAVPLAETSSLQNKNIRFSPSESVPTPEPSSGTPVNEDSRISVLMKEEDDEQSTHNMQSQDKVPTNQPVEIVPPETVYPKLDEKQEPFSFSSKPIIEDKSYAPSFPFKSKPFPQEKEKFAFSPFAKFRPKLFQRDEPLPQRREDSDGSPLFDPTTLLGKASTFLRRSLSGVLPFQSLSEKLDEKNMFSILENSASEGPMISKLASRQLLPSLAPLLLLPPLSPISSLLSSSSSQVSPFSSLPFMEPPMESISSSPYSLYPHSVPPMSPTMMIVSPPSLPSYFSPSMSFQLPPQSPMLPAISSQPVYLPPPSYYPHMLPIQVSPPHPSPPTFPYSISLPPPPPMMSYSMSPLRHLPPPPPSMFHRPAPLFSHPASSPSQILPFSQFMDNTAFVPPPPPPPPPSHHSPFRSSQDFPFLPPPPPSRPQGGERPFSRPPPQESRFNFPPTTTQEIQIPIEIPVPVPIAENDNSIHPRYSSESTPGQVTEEIIFIPRGEDSNIMSPDSLSYKADGANEDTYLLLYPGEDNSFSMRPPFPMAKPKRPMPRPGPLFNAHRSQQFSSRKINLLRDLLLSKSLKLEDEPRPDSFPPAPPPSLMMSVQKGPRMQHVIEQTRIFTRMKPTLLSDSRGQNPEDEASFHRPIFRPPGF